VLELRTEPATIVHQDPVLQVATWRDLVVQRWTATGGADNIRTLQKVQRDIVAGRKNRKLYLLAWIQLSEVGSPDEETRKGFNELREQLSASLGGSVVILEGTGFGASIIRGIISSQRMFKRSAYPSVVKANVREAATFLAPIMSADTGQVISPLALEDVLFDVASRLNRTTGPRLSRPPA
jgi:hypothetical protein